MEKEYKEISKRYDNLARNLKSVFEDFLNTKNIYGRVVYRIKTYQSFIEKIERHGFKKPFSDINDICGFRIIIRNSDEIIKVNNIIRKEFVIIESENKDSGLNPDQFGYRSHHMIAKIDPNWVQAPQYRNTSDLIFEIQIRSELMDAWANISHQIFYKKTTLNEKLQRRLFRLSALMEIGDEEIQQI